MDSPEPIDIEAHWSDAVETYKNHPTSRHRRRFVVNALDGEPFGPDTFVFDYGCGAGLALEDVKRRFGLRDDQVGGCDISTQAVARARERISSPHFICGGYPEVDRPIHYVICSEVIEHTAEYRAILVWIRDHLVPGGVLVLTTPGGTLDPPDRYYGHVQHFRLPGLVAQLNELGFDVERARLWGFPCFTLQRWMTKRHFDRVKDAFMGGPLSLSKRAVFTAFYYLYFVHDLIPYGSQIFIKARRRA